MLNGTSDCVWPQFLLHRWQSAPWSGLRMVLGGLMLLLGAGEAPAAEPSLLFSVTYNGQTERADWARGNPGSLNFSRSLQFAQAPGVIGPGFQTQDNERCHYAMTGNFDPRQGTLSLWVRPENWRPADKQGHVFFAAEIPGKYKLLLSKPAGEADVALEVSLGEKGAKRLVKCPADCWQPTVWHKLDASWTSEVLALYVDGELAAEEPKETRPTSLGFCFPSAEKSGWISINPNNYFKDEPGSSPVERTSVDEVKIFDRVLPAGLLREAYMAVKTLLSGGVYRKPMVTIPRRTAAVKLDGKLSLGEWDTAAKVPILCSMGRNVVATHLADVMLQYDEQNLYLGFHAQGEKSPLARQTRRDGYIWEDGALEFTWETAEPSKSRFHVVINSVNAVFDLKNNDPKWNGVTRTAAGLDGDGWSAEIALSFRDLGVVPPRPGTRWSGNFMHDWDQRSAGFATWAMASLAGACQFSNVTLFGTLVFGEDVAGARIESLGDLAAGKVNAKVALAGGTAAVWKLNCKVISGKVPPWEMDKTIQSGASAVFSASALLGKESLLALTATDAAGHATLIYDQVFQAKPPLMLTYQCWPNQRRADISLDLSNMDAQTLARLAKGGVEGEVSLFDTASKQVMSRVRVVATKPLTTCTLPLPKALAQGMYQVRARFPKPDGGDCEQVKSLEVPPEEPLNSTLGVDHTVPEPWTPIQIVGPCAKVLDREYTLGQSPFPVQMTSKSQDVLAEPVQWLVTSAAGEEPVVWDAPRKREQFKDLVGFEGCGRLKRSGISVSYQATLEFDGQWQTSVTLAPPKSGPVEIRAMRLAYAVPTASATYVLAPLVRPWHEDRVQINLFENINETANRTTPLGLFWITGMKAGLCFFTTTDGNWVYTKGQPNVRIERGPTTVKVHVQLIDKPVTLRKPATYVLGLTATPTKPQPRRSWSSGDHEWTNQAGQWQSWCSLVPLEPDVLRKSVEAKRKQGYKFLYQYSCIWFLGPNSHYEGYWGPTWDNGRKEFASDEYFVGCPNSTIRNLEVCQTERLIREFHVSPYYDVSAVAWCGAKAHGCGYIDSFGRPAKTSTLPGFRDGLKRIYKLVHRYGGQVFSHNHSYFIVPVHAFTDIWHPGEQYAADMVNRMEHFYTHEVPLLDYRVEMNPSIHGVQMLFLPEFARAAEMAGDKDWECWQKDSHAWAAEQVLTMILPHDLANSGYYMAPGPSRRVAEVYRNLGIVQRVDDPRPDPVFTGYWDHPKLKVDDPETLLSYYTFRDKNRLVAVLSNPSPKAKLVHLSVDAGLGLRNPLTCRDEYRDEPLPDWRERGIRVPPENFRLLLIEPAGDRP